MTAPATIPDATVLAELRARTLAFVASCRVEGPRYRYSCQATQPTLYSSCYAALTLSLHDELPALPEDERRAWAEYLNAHQDEDGLYRDPVIFGEGWYVGDPLTCGRAHLTCHVLPALAALGATAPREFALVRKLREPRRLERWLSGLDFSARVAWSGNEIMNVGTLLQYARDTHGDDRAGWAVELLLGWLDTHHLDPATGVWGDLDVRDPVQRSHAVQAAYHWWPLYAYDDRPIPCVERALDTVLATRNPRGSFGWGVHNPSDPHAGSACEDIDSIDPLVRLGRLTDHRADEVRDALRGAVAWVLSTRLPDGGFPFVPGRAFSYGHPQLASAADRGAMFPTWFRTLALALAGQGLPEDPIGRYPWRFVRCPGYQF